MGNMGGRPAAGLEGRRVVVTGGTGFIGSWLCQRLLLEGALVWCVDAAAPGSSGTVAHLLPHPGFTMAEADVSLEVPDPGQVDLVLHVACPASLAHPVRVPLETLRMASAGTGNALELAQRHGARFVLATASTTDAGEHPDGGRSDQDESQRFAEATAMAYHRANDVDVAIARVFDTYGPRMGLGEDRVVARLLGQAVRGEPLTVGGDGSRLVSLCWVEDVVDGLLRLGSSSERGPFDLGSDTTVSVLELAELVLAVTGSSAGIEHVARNEPHARRPDVRHAQRALGWAPTTSLQDGLKRTALWMEEVTA
jgi:dTDP-glucose 4,6-dehydratase